MIDRSAAYVAAILLHPDCRKSYLTSTWKPAWVVEGVKRARELWQQRYKPASERPSSSEDQELTLSRYERWQQEVRCKQLSMEVGALDEFGRFINAPPDTNNMSVMDRWLEPAQQRTYTHLQKMAIDVLTALAMSAESERVFSGTRRIITWSRASLEARMIEALECLKHWITSSVVDEVFDSVIEVVESIEDDDIEL